MTPGDPIERLPGPVRARLERFADAFHALDMSAYPAFAAASHDVSERQSALQRVQEVIGVGPRRAAVLAALAEFREFAMQVANEALGGVNTILLTRSNPSSAEERVRFLASLELAVATVILWDEIEPDERDDLLGPWAAMAERAARRD